MQLTCRLQATAYLYLQSPNGEQTKISGLKLMNLVWMRGKISPLTLILIKSPLKSLWKAGTELDTLYKSQLILYSKPSLCSFRIGLKSLKINLNWYETKHKTFTSLSAAAVSSHRKYWLIEFFLFHSKRRPPLSFPWCFWMKQYGVQLAAVDAPETTAS